MNGLDSQREDTVVITLEGSAEVASPYLPSRLLCPANLGALLETTTATLVSRGWKETNGGGSSNICSEEGRDGVGEVANVNFPGISRREDVANWQESVLRSSQVL